MGRVSFGTTTIEYRVEHRPNRRTVAVSVDPSGGVIVSAPPTADPSPLAGIVKKRARWILDQRARHAAVARPRRREYVSGESFPYLGRNYRLIVQTASGETGLPPVKLERGQFWVTVADGGKDDPQAERVRHSIRGWYVDHAKRHLETRTAAWARQVGVRPPRVSVVDQRQRWGSCDKHGTIRLNWRIIMAPLALVDYLCAHEACHLVVPNHSPAFWRRLASLMPDYEGRREQLRLSGPLFDLPEPG